MKLGLKEILGCTAIFIGLLGLFLSSELLPSLFVVLVGIIVIITGIFDNKDKSKIYYQANFSVMALWGLFLIYIFLFRPQEYLAHKTNFYFQIALGILFLSYFIGSYSNRNEPKTPLKEE